MSNRLITYIVCIHNRHSLKNERSNIMSTRCIGRYVRVIATMIIVLTFRREIAPTGWPTWPGTFGNG